MSRIRPSVLLLSVVFAAACSKGEGGDARAATPGGQGGAGGAGGRRGATITLAQPDIGRVARLALEEGVSVTGDLRPIETQEVRARIEGDLTDVYVREGERVAKGQVLARFEASEEQSARRSAEAEEVAARGDLSTAEWNFQQSKELFTAGAVPERDLRVAEQTVATARARLAAAQARVRAASSTEEDTRVVAPTTGVVERRAVEPGERVQRGAVMFTVVRTDVLELAASLPAAQSEAVRPGQVVRFEAQSRELQGRVARVSPTIDPTTRAVTVYVQVPNPGNTIRGGTNATGRVVTRTIPDALVVPSGAIRPSPTGERTLVYRIANQELEPVTVGTGAVDDARALTQVTSGLREGDVVVVGNVGTLGRGMKVTIIGADTGSRGAPPARAATGG
ncbi:MAG TPA: efflux RND transporter periplasmic adaptor subunit [Gemmatimonadaceae bacterium]|nr:efflux RND transporter periplasmic adaptor subunit [Gemmatimonadaceae bacterium]